MMATPEHHLTQTQLFVALIDADDLSLAQRSHLDRCPRCRQALATAQTPFDRIGELAERHTPGPVKRFRLQAPISGSSKRFFRAAGMIGGMAALMLLVIVWGGRIPRDTDLISGDQHAEAIMAAAVFMADVDRLIDDPLPTPYRGLIDVLSTDGGDDWMDLIVPPLSVGEPTTRFHRSKGEPPC